MANNCIIKHLTFRLKPDQLLAEEIVAHTWNIQAGVLLSIVGALKNANLRMAGATPDDQRIVNFKGPFEIVSGTGTISKNYCHIHIAVSDKEGNVIGGHLKNGCRVDVTVEVVIGVLADTIFNRVLDKSTGFKELEVG